MVDTKGFYTNYAGAQLYQWLTRKDFTLTTLVHDCINGIRKNIIQKVGYATASLIQEEMLHRVGTELCQWCTNECYIELVGHRTI